LLTMVDRRANITKGIISMIEQAYGEKINIFKDPIPRSVRVVETSTTDEPLSGNRRKMACEIAGVPTLPMIIRELDDHSAAIAMVDSNLEQRETLLYSEKAWAYRVKMEALNHIGVKAEMHSVEVLVAQTGESKNQIFRLIRLTELVCTLLDKVDAKQLAFNPAVELSYLSQSEQAMVADAMDNHAISMGKYQQRHCRGGQVWDRETMARDVSRKNQYAHSRR